MNWTTVITRADGSTATRKGLPTGQFLCEEVPNGEWATFTSWTSPAEPFEEEDVD